MKLYFYKNTTNLKEYSVRLIEHLLKPWMCSDPAEADYTLVSICDITEIGDILKAKKLGKPIITGGMISEYPVVNELSDHTWHGEIYSFRDCLREGVSIEDMPSITTRAKKNLVIDQKINWAENPIIKVGSRAMYYYVSKGCPLACKYCYIGNVRDYQTAPKSLYDRALRTAGKNIMPIAAYNPYGIPAGANIGETLLKKYVSGEQGAGAKMIRSGIEFTTPELSKALAKGVTIEMLNESLIRSKAEKTKMILYLIAGLEPQEAIIDFFSAVRADYATMPAVNVVFTYIDPQPFTPMYDFDVRRKITNINTKEIYRVVSERNKRFRVLPLAGPEKSTVRTLLGRCESVEDYNRVRQMAKMNHQEIIDRCEDRLLGVAGLEEICARPRKATVPAYWRG